MTLIVAGAGGIMEPIERTTRYLFFTGKGGVGKTSTACATAIELADAGRRVLLISTDPASNLDQVLEQHLTSHPTAIRGVNGLFALNIDPEAAARQYRERVVGPYLGILPEDALASMNEQLSGACTVEVAAFDEFTAFLGGDGEAAAFDHIVFDTAPTGHTLRLLQLPAAWTGFIDTNERGASCLGPASGLKTQQVRYAAAVASLADPVLTRLVLVARPESAAIVETERTSRELAALGLKNQHLIINGVFHATDKNDRLAVTVEARGKRVISSLPPRLSSLPRTEIALRGHNIVGIDALRELTKPVADNFRAEKRWTEPLPVLPSLAELMDQFEETGRGLIMLMGKGGVGKTSVAAAIAVELVDRGFPVHLTTTDPAAHLANVLPETVDGLRISRIDPVAETAAYTEKIIRSNGKKLDADGLELLEEDLRSPCTEEVAVFHAFSRIVASARREIVVMDTAPTGHTLLLLDATGSYHREVLRNSVDSGVNLVTPMMRLRDPSFTKVLIVTLAETTPVTEAADLQSDLRRASIEPFAWIVNNSVAAAHPTDPLLAERARAELGQITKVRDELCSRMAVVPMLAKEPRGYAALIEMTRQRAVATSRGNLHG